MQFASVTHHTLKPARFVAAAVTATRMTPEERESFAASIIPRFVFLVWVLLAVASMIDLQAFVAWTEQHKLSS